MYVELEWFCSRAARIFFEKAGILGGPGVDRRVIRGLLLSALAGSEATAQGKNTLHKPLEELDLLPVVDVHGSIHPEIPNGTEATVFAIYEQGKSLQYIGFSKDLRNSLRTVFVRRPDKAYFYRALHLPHLDQEEMIEIRKRWFDESGGPPPGNKVPLERNAWQSPPQALALNDRGKQAAAEELAKQLLVKLRSRGCQEEFLTDTDALARGEVVFLATDALTEAELAERKAAIEAMATATRCCMTEIDGEAVPFDIFFGSSIQTNGGFMFDVRITCQEKETPHRVIVGRDYFEPQNLDPEAVVEKVFAFLLSKKVTRKTTGMLTSGQFPMNYFSVSEVQQFFPGFEEYCENLPERKLLWGFNKTQDYGAKGENEDIKAFAKQLSLPNDNDEDDEMDGWVD